MSIDLKKNSTISLLKKDGQPISKITFGIGWKATIARNKLISPGKINAAALAVVYDTYGAQIINIDNRTTNNHSVVYEGRGLADVEDDQRITVKIKDLQDDEKVYLCLTSESHQKLNLAEDIYIRGLVKDQEIFRYDVFQTFASNSAILLKIEKQNDQYTLAVIDRFANILLLENIVSVIESWKI